MQTVAHTPAPADPDAMAPATAMASDCATLEHALAGFFGGHVVLTSSGRAAISLLLMAQGLNRYRDRVAVPRMISACVLDAIVPHAFPVDRAAASGPMPSIIYHQYGIRQALPGSPDAIEDLCHAFFMQNAQWRDGGAMAAVFSLPKFFSTSGMIGGVVTANAGLAEKARDLIAATHRFTDADRKHQAQIFRQGMKVDQAAFHHLYVDRFIDMRPHPCDLTGLPGDAALYVTARLRRIGAARRWKELLPPTTLLAGWAGQLVGDAPFLWPVFGDATKLAAIDRAIAGLGVTAGCYRLDTNRDARTPSSVAALMLPLHDGVTDEIAENVARIVRRGLGA